MFIYIIKNKIAFYDDTEDYTAKKLYKKLLKEYGCEPVIIKLEPDENNEFAVTAEITPAQVLHLADMQIEFQKVKAHSGIDLNERVDKLAKSACGM